MSSGLNGDQTVMDFLRKLSSDKGKGVKDSKQQVLQERAQASINQARRAVKNSRYDKTSNIDIFKQLGNTRAGKKMTRSYTPIEGSLVEQVNPIHFVQKLGQLMSPSAGVQQAAQAAVQGRRALPGNLNSLESPIPGSDLNSNYGPRHSIMGSSSYHTGVDLDGEMGTPIRAADNGVVKSAQEAGAFGNQIILGHGGNYQTMYGHMSGFNVKPGDKVKKGQVIGYVGMTGRSTGPHLHFETWQDGKPMNPMNFL